MSTRRIVYLCAGAASPDVAPALSAAGLTAIDSRDPGDAIREIDAGGRAHVLVDLTCPGALDAVVEVLRHRPRASIVALADRGRPQLGVEAIRAGIADVLSRPLDPCELIAMLDRLDASGRALAAATPASTPAVHGLFGRSPAMREIIDIVVRAAATRDGVLVSGEPGTGRHAVARAIHLGGMAAPASFVAIDGSERPAAVEGDLFGAKGVEAAAGRRKSLETVAEGSGIDRARGGTLFLRNLPDMPGRLQVRLLRVLRDGEAWLASRGTARDARRAAVRRVPAEVRPIVAVDGSFYAAQAALADGRVRPDLFRLVSGVRIALPPLRRRREDIPDLAHHLLDGICASIGRGVKVLDDGAMTLLVALPWRRNGRELRGLLDVLARRVPGSVIRLEDVLPHVRLDGGFFPSMANGTLREARDRFEHDYIVSMLQQYHGRIPDAARALGLQRTNLYRKMRTLRVVPRARSL